MGTAPLRGIRVLEHGGKGPSQFGGMLLADLGADVIRVDRPTGLDRPMAGYDPRLDLLNRGRRSIALGQRPHNRADHRRAHRHHPPDGASEVTTGPTDHRRVGRAFLGVVLDSIHAHKADHEAGTRDRPTSIGCGSSDSSRPRRTVSGETPTASATTRTPLDPSSRASAPNQTRRCRSVRCGLTAS